MATKDFRASQLETSKIIGSGSISGTGVGIAIYSGSVASNRQGGTNDAAMFSKVGSDVFLFVSGTIDNTNNTRTNATLFGGDVVVSGTLYAERQVIEVDSVADGDFFVTGNMYVEPDVNSDESVSFRKADGTRVLKVNTVEPNVNVDGDLILTGGIYMTNASGDEIIWEAETNFVLTAQNSIQFKLDSDNDTSGAQFMITDNAGNIQHVFYEDGRAIFNNAQNSPGSITVRGSTDLGLVVADLNNNVAALGSTTNIIVGRPDIGTDVKILLSGTVGSRGGATRGTTLVAGDMVVSGNITALGTTTGFSGGGGSNTLDQAYDQGGTGAGAKITVDGQPIQLLRGTPGSIVLAVTGSSVFGETSSQFGNQLPPLPGDDVTFFASGSVGGFGSNTGGVSVFGGDTAISGSLSLEERKDILFGGHLSKNSINGDGPFLNVSSDDMVTFNSGSASSPTSHDESTYTDINFFNSGSVGSKNTATRGTALFGGDLVASGSVYGRQMQVYHHFDNISVAGTEHFLGVHEGQVDASFNAMKHNRIVPFKGRIKAFAVRSSATDNSNNLVIKFYSNLFNAANSIAGTAITKNVAYGTAQNNTTVTDKVGLEFNQGGVIGISVQRSSTAPGDIHIALTVEYDIFDDPVL
jgi:hypothetical protein|tara:strand:- start:20366 stop:22279 length:1914 start_codon:yes stop_codon:yes gene_type:complete